MDIQIVEISCSDCGTMFWITEEHDCQLRDTHARFYCPNGHANHYPENSKEEKRIIILEKNRDYWKAKAQRLEAQVVSERNRANNYKGRYRKEKERV